MLDVVACTNIMRPVWRIQNPLAIPDGRIIVYTTRRENISSSSKTMRFPTPFNCKSTIVTMGCEVVIVDAMHKPSNPIFKSEHFGSLKFDGVYCTPVLNLVKNQTFRQSLFSYQLWQAFCLFLGPFCNFFWKRDFICILLHSLNPKEWWIFGVGCLKMINKYIFSSNLQTGDNEVWMWTYSCSQISIAKNRKWLKFLERQGASNHRANFLMRMSNFSITKKTPWC